MLLFASLILFYLPRTRGDKPHLLSFCFGVIPSTPHTRG